MSELKISEFWTNKLASKHQEDIERKGSEYADQYGTAAPSTLGFREIVMHAYLAGYAQAEKDLRPVKKSHKYTFSRYPEHGQD